MSFCKTFFSTIIFFSFFSVREPDVILETKSDAQWDVIHSIVEGSCIFCHTYRTAVLNNQVASLACALCLNQNRTENWLCIMVHAVLDCVRQSKLAFS